MQTKMIPLLQIYSQDRQLVFELLKVLLLMTDAPHASASAAEKKQQHEVLYIYKDLFLNEDVLALLMQVVYEPLGREGSERNEADCKFIELVLHIFKNLLLVPDAQKQGDTTASGNDHLTHMHDNLLLAFQEESVLEMIIIMSQDIRERRYSHWGFLVLEMLATIFRNKTPEALIEATRHHKMDVDRRQAAKEAQAEASKENGPAAKPKPKIDPNDPLFDALHRDRCQRREAVSSTLGTRHSRFTGAFRTDEHKGFRQTLVETKKAPPKKRGGRKKPLMTPPNTTVNPAVAKTLLDFAEDFVTTCYNPLLAVVVPTIVHQQMGAQLSDGQNFCEVSAMLLTLHAHSQQLTEDQVGYIAQGIEPHNFTYLIQYCEENSEIKLKQWHLIPAALKCIRAMLGIILRVDNTSGAAAYRAAQRLMLNLTYENRLLELVAKLLREYDICHHDKTYLADLIGTSHNVLKMIDGFSKSEKPVLVKKKGRKKKAEGNLAEIEDDGGEEEDDNTPLPVAETMLDATKAIEMFAHPKTIQNYVFLATDYAKNRPETNHHITRMWHRVVTVEEGRNMPVLYQLSTFNIFNKMLQDSYMTESPRQDLKDMNEFVCAIVRRFFRAGVDQHAIFIEPLFVKNSRKELENIAFGYQDEQDRRKPKDNNWEQEEEANARRAWDDNEDQILKDNYPRLSAKVGVMQRLAALLTDRSAQQISRRLVALGLRTKGIQPKRGKEAAASTFLTKSIDQVETEAVQLLEACERVATHPKLRARHMATGLGWVLETFHEAKLDRDDANFEAVRQGSKKPEPPADYPLIPLNKDHWELLKRPWADRVLTALCCRSPTPCGEAFWRIPRNLDDKKVELVIRVLEGWFGDRATEPNPEEGASQEEAGVASEGQVEEAQAEEAEPVGEELDDVDDPSKSWEHQVNIDELVDRAAAYEVDDGETSSDDDDWGDGPAVDAPNKPVPARKIRSRKASKAAASKINDGTATLEGAVSAEGEAQAAGGDSEAESEWEASGDEEEEARPKKKLKKLKKSGQSKEERKEERKAEKKAKKKAEKLTKFQQDMREKNKKEEKKSKWKNLLEDATGGAGGGVNPTTEQEQTPQEEQASDDSDSDAYEIDEDAEGYTEPQPDVVLSQEEEEEEEGEEEEGRPAQKKRLKKRALDSDESDESEDDHEEGAGVSPSVQDQSMVADEPAVVETQAAKRRRTIIEDSDEE